MKKILQTYNCILPDVRALSLFHNQFSRSGLTTSSKRSYYWKSNIWGCCSRDKQWKIDWAKLYWNKGPKAIPWAFPALVTTHPVMLFLLRIKFSNIKTKSDSFARKNLWMFDMFSRHARCTNVCSHMQAGPWMTAGRVWTQKTFEEQMFLHCNDSQWRVEDTASILEDWTGPQ